jgi:D-tyrosyl-tRNA(Tyr) deacylase
VDGKESGRIDSGLMILLGVTHDDTEEEVEWLAEKCVNLRIFEDQEGKFNLSLIDVGGSVMVVSQFTLYGDCRRGRRPGFTRAADPSLAESLYQAFVNTLRKKGIDVATGIFAARMDVDIVNHGPVTLIVDTENRGS